MDSCCVFCGIAPMGSKRWRSMSSIGQFVLQCCKATPYAYRGFSGLEGDECLSVCIPCLNWQRRSSLNRKSEKPYLLLDHLILFLLEPGKMHMPDQRCALRLLQSLRDANKGNVLKLMFQQIPVPVQCIIQSLPDSLFDESAPVLHTLVLTWWDYNGNTVFFSHNQTAKLVRKAVKARENQEVL